MRFDRDSKAEYVPPIFAYREMSQRHKSLQGLVCSYRIFSEMKENTVMIPITRIESQRRLSICGQDICSLFTMSYKPTAALTTTYVILCIVLLFCILQQ